MLVDFYEIFQHLHFPESSNQLDELNKKWVDFWIEKWTQIFCNLKVETNKQFFATFLCCFLNVCLKFNRHRMVVDHWPKILSNFSKSASSLDSTERRLLIDELKSDSCCLPAYISVGLLTILNSS